MCKLEHLIRYTVGYYHKILIFALLERRLVYDYETGCSFVYLITFIIIIRSNTYHRLTAAEL